MSKKYYVIVKGKKPGIYNSWDEAKQQVNGFKGAIYKSFASHEEAQKYFSTSSENLNDEMFSDGDVELQVKQDNENGIYTFFVDGSFNKYFQKIGFGVVCVFNDIIHEHSETLDQIEIKRFSDSLNIVGEVFGSLYAIKYAIANNYKKIKIYFDYEGIEKWATKMWTARSEIATYYLSEFEKLSENNDIQIKFQKVRAHVNIKYNEIADKLAKNAVCIKNK